MSYMQKYGEARHIYVALRKANSNNHAVGADWTPGAGDVKISKDGGAAANVTNLPTAIAMGNSAIWDFHLTATEMQAAQVVVTVADSATKAVEDDGFVIETYGNSSAQHAFDLDTAMASQTVGTATAVTTVNGLANNVITAASIAADAITAAKIADGAIDAGTFAAGAIDAAAIAANAIGASELAADAVTEIQSGLALAADLATAITYIDTEVAAIKAKTDSLNFTVAGQVDANIQYVNDVAVTGTGASGNEWGPA